MLCRGEQGEGWWGAGTDLPPSTFLFDPSTSQPQTKDHLLCQALCGPRDAKMQKRCSFSPGAPGQVGGRVWEDHKHHWRSAGPLAEVGRQTALASSLQVALPSS